MSTPTPEKAKTTTQKIDQVQDKRKALIKSYNKRQGALLPTSEKNHNNDPLPLPVEPKVAIVGAGLSGLSLAYLLQEGFKDKKFDITLFESQDRIGGRVHTVHFTDEGGNPRKDQFAELGAMRLPFGTNELNFERIINAVTNLDLKLIEWNSELSPSYIDYKLRKNVNISFEELLPEFKDRIPTEYLGMTPSALNLKIIVNDRNFFSDATSVEEGLRNLLKARPEADQWSYRDAINSHIQIEFKKFWKIDKLTAELLEAIDNMIDQIELFESATGLLNLSWIEALIDSYTFDHVLKTVAGGLSQIPNGIRKLLNESVKFKLNSRVFKVDRFEGVDKKVRIHWTNVTAKNVESQEYDLVFVTAPFSSLRDWTWTESISKLRRNFFRQLNYDNSSKIYVHWPEKVANWAKVIGDLQKGATLTTDLMIRKIVYPANNESDHVTLVSYTWAQDALAWCTLNDNETLDLVVRQVNQIHGTNFDPAQCQILKKEWTTDKNYFGAFALYSPTQFMSLEKLQEPEYQGRLYFAGEHLSYNHAWLAGAVSSAYRALGKLAKQQCWQFNTLNTIFEKNSVPIKPKPAKEKKTTNYKQCLGDACGAGHGHDHVITK